MIEQLKIEPKTPHRNYGIETLRIVSMFLVCVLHVLGQGGVLRNTQPQSVNYYTSWFLEIAAYCAVNCYALISGWAGVNSKYKFSNLIFIWIQVFSYSVGITAIFMIAGWEPFSWSTLLHSFLPVTFCSYWYFTAYFCLFLFMPLLNIALKNISQKAMACLLIILVGIVSVFSRFNGDLFSLDHGYSALWLIILYLLGGFIRECQPLRKIKSKWLVLIWIGCIVLTWVCKLAIEMISINIGGNLLVSYVSPTIIMVAVSMIELFSRISFTRKPKLLSILASTSFGVYLIHVHPLMWKYLYDVFAKYATYNAALLALCVLGTAGSLYLACCFVDYLRLLLFKVIHLREFLQKLETKIRTKLLDDALEQNKDQP